MFNELMKMLQGGQAIPGITNQQLPMTQNMGDMGALNDLMAAQPGNFMRGGELFARQRQIPGMGQMKGLLGMMGGGQRPMPNSIGGGGLFGQMAQPNPMMQGQMPNLAEQQNPVRPPGLGTPIINPEATRPSAGQNMGDMLTRLYMMRRNGMF